MPCWIRASGSERRHPHEHHPQGRRPQGQLRHRRRCRAGRRRCLVRAAGGRGAGHRRRVRLGQKRYGADDHRAHPRPNARITGSVTYRGRELNGLDDDQLRDVRGEQIAMVFQDPMTLAEPGLSRRRPDHGDDPGASRRLETRGRRPCGRAVAFGGHPESRAPGAPLSARVLGRDAPARDDRDGARPRAGRADRRRADHRARRHGAGPDPAPASTNSTATATWPSS